jgi:energy-coupling factor transporter ATP-binding protein EcfA2
LTCPADGCKWIIIFGENGVGKTTILRSIAMALSDETSTYGLLSELSGDMIRKGCKKGLIELEVIRDESNEPVTLTTTLLRKSPKDKDTTVKKEPKKFPWDDIFACGYGAARRAFGSESYEKYKLIDSVYTLFNYDASLQNPEVPFSRLEREDINVNDLFPRIEKILGLPKDSVKLDRSGFSVKGHWGSFQPLGAIADGYSATFAWISDLIGWAALFQKSKFRPDFAAIVLLDELEHHLHPSWQKRIILDLCRQFPKIQFIGTTHAPMCAVGTTDLDDDECELIKLTQRGEYVEGTAGHKPPRGKRADQILTSYLFGLGTSGDRETREQIEKYSALLSKKDRDATEEKQLKDLRAELDKKLGSEETELERVVGKAVFKVLSKTPSSSRNFTQESLKYETRRQLKELLGDVRIEND